MKLHTVYLPIVLVLSLGLIALAVYDQRLRTEQPT